MADQSVGRLFDVEWDWATDEPGTSVGLGVSVRAEQNQTAPDLKARADGKTQSLPPSTAPYKKRELKKRENGNNESLTKRTERGNPPPPVSGAVPAASVPAHGKRRFSESFKREDMQKRGRMVRRHRRSVAHQGVEEPVA